MYCVIRKNLSTPSSGAQKAPTGQVSSQTPIAQAHSGSFTEAKSSRFFPFKSVRHACHVIVVDHFARLAQYPQSPLLGGQRQREQHHRNYQMTDSSHREIRLTSSRPPAVG